MKLAVVIPAFDEARTIREVVALAALLERRSSSSSTTDRPTAPPHAALTICPCQSYATRDNRGRRRRLGADSTWHLLPAPTMSPPWTATASTRLRIFAGWSAAAHSILQPIIIGARLLDREQRAPEPAHRKSVCGLLDLMGAGYAIADSQSGERLYPTRLLRMVTRHDRSTSFTFESAMLIRGARMALKAWRCRSARIYASGARAATSVRVRDIARIVLHGCPIPLLARGLYPPGLWNSRARPGRGRSIAARRPLSEFR